MLPKISLAASLLSFLFLSSSFADHMGPHGDKFYEEAGHFVQACRENPCAKPYSKALVYDRDANVNQISFDLKFQLQRIAFYQAQIWGDTILEGDYYAAGQTRLDKIIAFYKESQIVGYKIQYSEKAWYVGECEYDDTPASLAGCKEGSIKEESYVSADFKTYFSDEENYAAFF